jgi:hypothetical protein
VISLGAIQPAWAKPGSCSITIRCSRFRCQTTTAIIARNSGTMMKAYTPMNAAPPCREAEPFHSACRVTARE